MRKEVSKKNKYYVEAHRTYELKHFCRQYPMWKKAYLSLDGLQKRQDDLEKIGKTNNISDPTTKCAEARDYYIERINMVDNAAKLASPELWEYIVKGVTEGLPYDTLKIKYNIPCCRTVYYEKYRKFFYILNSTRN